MKLVKRSDNSMSTFLKAVNKLKIIELENKKLKSLYRGAMIESQTLRRKIKTLK